SKNQWAIREFQITNSLNGTSHNFKMEYSEHRNGTPILATRRVLLKDSAGEVFEDSVATVEGIQRNVSPDEFRLSYYGFPEPDFAGPRKTWSMWLYLSLGLISVAIAALFRWRKNKAERTLSGRPSQS